MKKEGTKVIVGGLTIFMGLFVSYGCGYIKGAIDLSQALDEDYKKRSKPTSYSRYRSYARPTDHSIDDVCKIIDELVIDSRKEAEEVINALTDIIERYGEACVFDLYDLVGVPSNPRDSRFGWKQLDVAEVMKTKHGYKLVLSKPIKL